jgi:tetratricopeptide (TPR) repeat protein
MASRLPDQPGQSRQAVRMAALIGWWRRPVLRRGLSRGWAAVGVLATLTGLWGSYGRFFTGDPPPPVMRGTLNVAITNFGSADSRGRDEATAKLATDVASAVADLLTEELRPLATRLRIEVRGPAQLPQVRGASAAARADEARNRARQIDADVVVYGVLTTDGNNTVLQPELYVADSIRGDIGESVGDHPWGPPLELPGAPENNPLLAQQMGEQLSARTKALASMIPGIWYYRANQPIVARRYLKVAAATDGWRDQDGKEIVYLFLGNAAERHAAQQQRLSQDTVARRWFNQAVGYYRQALRIDGQYARAYYGIAETRFLQVDLSCRPRRTDREQLEQVVRDLKRAQVATNRPALANIDAKIAFGLGRAYVCMTLAGVANRQTAAEHELEAVLKAFQESPPQDPSALRLREIAAEAYAQRGLLATTYAGSPDARVRDLRTVEDYKQAIILSPDRPSRLRVFYENLADTYDRLRMPREAGEARRRAAELGASTSSVP